MDTPTDTQYTPGEVAARFGLSLDTLRYYEREGLLTEVERAPSGHRRYRASDVELLDLVRCLRDTDMPIARLRQVVLSWLIDHDPPVIPLVGVTTVAQVDEAVEATDLKLTAEQRQLLDDAR